MGYPLLCSLTPLQAAGNARAIVFKGKPDGTLEANMDKIKVLIAEDSITQAMQLQHILEKNGYDTTVVSNGSEALQVDQQI